MGILNMPAFNSLSILLFIPLSSADVFTESAIFERLCHFKNDGVVNHLNSVDQAMIADGSCRMVRSELDGYALWKNPETTTKVIEALKDVLPPTGKPSHFVLSSHAVLDELCPVGDEWVGSEEYSCHGGGHDLEVMAGAMHNWHRALCAGETDPEWEGEYDPAYQPQQVALTAGFMCILACDCNENSLPASSLASFAESPETADILQEMLCSTLPWGTVDFADGSADVDMLAELAAPLMGVCGCEA